jgi:hypothetical protein
MSQKIVDRRKRTPAAPTPTEWIGGAITTLDGARVAAWVHRGRPVAQRSVDGVTLPEALGSLLAGAEAPRRPTRARVEAAVAAEMAAVEGVEVVAGEVPEVARMQAVLDDDVSLPTTGEPSLTRGGRIPVGVLTGLYEAAARMQMASPWRHLGEDDLVRVRCPALGLEVVASVFNLPEPGDGTRGIACFAGMEVFLRFQAEVQERGEEASENLPRFVVNLLTPRSLSPGVVREVKEHGLPVVEGRAVFVTGPELAGGPGQASPRQILQAWAVVEAVTWVAGREDDGKTLRFDALAERDASVTFVAAMIPGLPRVEVTPLYVDEAAAEAGLERPPTEAEAYAEEVWLSTEAWFEEALEAGRDRRSLRGFNMLADVLCGGLEDDESVKLTAWDDVDVGEWAQRVAEQVPVAPDELLPSLDDVAAWLRWCETSGRWWGGKALADLVLAARADFAARMEAATPADDRRGLDAYYEMVFGADEPDDAAADAT